MSYKIEVVSSFKRAAKKLQKRYKSFADDIEGFIENLKDNPFQGVDIGGGIRKIRLAISSKNKGKSGGARVITHTDVIIEMQSGTVTLLTVYDKSDQETISDSEIEELLRDAGLISK